MLACYEIKEMSGLTRWVHNATNDETTSSAACEMERWSVFHSQMLYKPPFREEVGRKLNRASKPCPHHRSSYASVKPVDTLCLVYLPHAIHRILVCMLRTYWGKR